MSQTIPNMYRELLGTREEGGRERERMREYVRNTDSTPLSYVQETEKGEAPDNNKYTKSHQLICINCTKLNTTRASSRT